MNPSKCLVLSVLCERLWTWQTTNYKCLIRRHCFTELIKDASFLKKAATQNLVISGGNMTALRNAISKLESSASQNNLSVTSETSGNCKFFVAHHKQHLLSYKPIYLLYFLFTLIADIKNIKITFTKLFDYHTHFLYMIHGLALIICRKTWEKCINQI